MPNNLISYHMFRQSYATHPDIITKHYTGGGDTHLIQKLEEAARVQLSPMESIGVWVLERVMDPAWEKRPEESIGVYKGK
jgi:hypothetical protein